MYACSKTSLPISPAAKSGFYIYLQKHYTVSCNGAENIFTTTQSEWERVRAYKNLSISENYALTHHQFMIVAAIQTQRACVCVPRNPHTRNMFINYFFYRESSEPNKYYSVVVVDVVCFDQWEFRSGLVNAFNMATERNEKFSFLIVAFSRGPLGDRKKWNKKNLFLFSLSSEL